MINLYNFRIRKNNYFDYFIISWMICPKNKKYVISKGIKVNNKTKLIEVLKHFKKSKKINFIKEYLITWLDCGSPLD